MTKKCIDICEFQVDSKLYYVQRVTESIPNIDLYSQLSNCSIFPKMYWSHRDDDSQELVIGKLLETNNVPKIQLIQVLVGGPFELRFFGGKSFSKETDHGKIKAFKHFPHQYFFLPQYEIIQGQNQTHLYSYHISTTKSDVFNTPRLKIFDTPLKEESSIIQNTPKHYPTQQEWVDNLNQIQDKMKTTPLEKVVMARCSQYDLNPNANPFGFFKNLRKKFQRSSYFSLALAPNQIFLGATPECLYKRTNGEILTEAVAGTCRAEAKIDLLNSPKELKEFHYVTDFFSEKLNSLADKIEKSSDQILHIGYLKHLYAPFKAILGDKVDDEMLLDILFPSPALCGYPSNLALQQIDTIEPFFRGWYASPIGYLSQNRAQFNIAIRSCLITDQKVYIFVGNGVTKDSCPQAEWEELNAKISPLTMSVENALC